MLYAGFVTLNCVAGSMPNAAGGQGNHPLNAPAGDMIERVKHGTLVTGMKKCAFNQQMTDFNG